MPILKIGRRIDQSFTIGHLVKVTIDGLRPGCANVKIEAPQDVTIFREEIERERAYDESADRRRMECAAAFAEGITDPELLDALIARINTYRERVN